MSIGISEHHMKFKASLSAKPGSFLAVLYDACESFLRHGIKNILILNGHGGNTVPVQSSINQFLLRFEANVHFRPYWDLIPKEVYERELKTKVVPGHANEFETAFALAASPESVRTEYIDDEGAKAATRQCGKVLVEAAVTKTAEFLRGMIDGKIVAQIDPIVNEKGTVRRKREAQQGKELTRAL
jgi:creatinine amidohydrolase